MVSNVYDAGHPLRVSENLVLGFLNRNFVEVFRRHVGVATEVYEFDSVYFIGRRR